MATIFEPVEIGDIYNQDPVARNPQEVAEEARKLAMLSKIGSYIATHTAADFVSTTTQSAPNAPKHESKSYKRHGGHPPAYYTVIETFVDLRRYHEQGDLAKALPLYFYLRQIA